MRQRPQTSEGFSAVELLITLFIATIFLISGYQLWSQVQSSGVDSDHMARASNVSYDYLRRYTAQAPTCMPSTPVNNASITVSGLSRANVTVAITCPYGSSTTSPAIKQIVSTVTYGSPSNRESVSHAIFTN